MFVTRFLDELAKREWGDGSDFVAKELEKLIKELPLDEEELAAKVFDIYHMDRAQIWHDAQLPQVSVTCYNKTRVYPNAETAINYYTTGYYATEGAEQARYKAIVDQLRAGLTEVVDTNPEYNPHY